MALYITVVVSLKAVLVEFLCTTLINFPDIFAFLMETLRPFSVSLMFMEPNLFAYSCHFVCHLTFSVDFDWLFQSSMNIKCSMNMGC